MDIVKLSVMRPIGVAVGVLLVVMFGLIGLGEIPIQLTPTVDRPLITVTTSWPGRSPEEIVEDITKKQEEQLKNVSNLDTMTSTSSQGTVAIELDFVLGTDIDRAFQEVSDALRQVEEYPDEVNEPSVKAADGASENAIAWIIIDLSTEMQAQLPDFDITTLYDALDKEVKPYLERIDGVAEVNIFGGREREVRVLIDAVALAQRGLNQVDVVSALRVENRNVSAGTIAEGKRDYRVRVIGQFATTDEVLDTVISYQGGVPVYVRDVADVELGYVKKRGFVRSFGHPSIAMNVIRQSGSNVMSVMADVRSRLDEVRADILPNLDAKAGPHLRMRQVYDETIYIDSAITLVTQNLWLGGLLAGAVLLVFLRAFVPTAVIGLAIPVSVVGTFLVLLAANRTLNVISLAGLAFAVGMVVDNAIVVLENIDRRLRLGEAPKVAALRGGREVWGAILASSLTTVAVFVPVLTIQEEAGQLFRDIAIAIVGAVTLSLLVSITVIPAACAHWIRPPSANPGRFRRMFTGLFGLTAIGAWLTNSLASMVGWLIQGWRAWVLRPLVIVAMTAASIFGAIWLAPPMDYLPAGNRNLVFGGLLVPPGLSVSEMERVAQVIERQINPYANASISNPASMAGLAPISRGPAGEAFQPMAVENFFIGSFGGGMFVGATSESDRVVIPVGQLLTNAMTGIPDAFGGASQTSLFGNGLGGGNSVDVEISGPDLGRVKAAAEFIFTQLASNPKYGYGRVRPTPSNFNLTQPEMRVSVNSAGRELGLTTEGVGVAMRSLFDGAFVGEFRLGDRNVDLVVLPQGGRLEYKEQSAFIPIKTPAGPVVPIDTVVDFVPAMAPQEIRRVEELPTVSVSVRPPEGVSVDEVKNDVRTLGIEPAQDAGLLDRTMRLRLEGTAAQLDDVRGALFGGTSAAKLPGMFIWPLTAMILVGGLGACAVAAYRGVRRRKPSMLVGALGLALVGVLLAAGLTALGEQPALLTARFVWALAVVYLLMAALFESFIAPFVIMFSVPLAVVGGFAGLKIVHDITLADPTIAPQQLDVLTMLGFVILIGVVVNNAILLVHRALQLMKGEDAETEDGKPAPPLPLARALPEAVRSRVRPIFMSVLTSVGGMLPLVLFPGAGSEMYRGLGSVVIGGLLVSTVFTLLLVPLMFSLVEEMRQCAIAAF